MWSWRTEIPEVGTGFTGGPSFLAREGSPITRRVGLWLGMGHSPQTGCWPSQESASHWVPWTLLSSFWSSSSLSVCKHTFYLWPEPGRHRPAVEADSTVIGYWSVLPNSKAGMTGLWSWNWWGQSQQVWPVVTGIQDIWLCTQCCLDPAFMN